MTTTLVTYARCAAAAALLGASAVYATSIYRWVDDTGRPHVSDVVPDSYRHAAAASDCATWRRLFEESQACFAPYHNVNRSLKRGAYENCSQIDDPEPTCGPESWYPQD